MHALKWYFVLQLCCSAVTCTRKTIRSEILRCFYRRWGKICVENVYSCVCVWAYWQWSGNVLSTAALKRWRADIQHAAVHRGWRGEREQRREWFSVWGEERWGQWELCGEDRRSSHFRDMQCWRSAVHSQGYGADERFVNSSWRGLTGNKNMV